MSITFKRGKRIVSYAEATTVSEVLEISKRKSRSFCREERDRWDWRGYNEYIVAVEGRLPYMGHTVNFKTEKTSFRDKRRHQTSKDSWVVFENTQEAIIDEETFRLLRNFARLDAIVLALEKPIHSLACFIVLTVAQNCITNIG